MTPVATVEDARLPEPVLCLVKGERAWFTTRALDRQWGDDWDDAPYEHNAGSPYTPSWMDERDGAAPWEVVTVYVETDLEQPNEWHRNSPYSVDAINGRATPWLQSGKYAQSRNVQLWAGTPLRAFVIAIEETGGHVYMRLDDWTRWFGHHR